MSEYLNAASVAHMHSTEQEQHEKEERDHNLDKTIADSFPASDPPSTIPDPDHKNDEAA